MSTFRAHSRIAVLWLRIHRAPPVALALMGCAIAGACVGHLQVTNPFGTHFAVIRFTIALPTVAAALAGTALDNRLTPAFALPGREIRTWRGLWLLGVIAALALSLTLLAHLVGSRQILIDAAVLGGSTSLVLSVAGSGAAIAWPLLVLLPYLLETRIYAPPRWAILEPHATPHAIAIAISVLVAGALAYALRGSRPLRDVAGEQLD